MWSLGVTFFQILTGKLPFKSKDTAILIEEIKKGVFNIPQYLSKECNNFLSCLIKVDANQRMNVKDALNHKWIKIYNKINIP